MYSEISPSLQNSAYNTVDVQLPFLLIHPFHNYSQLPWLLLSSKRTSGHLIAELSGV